MGNSLVSVVITTKNEQAVIERLLKSLKNQTYKEIEIIVTDNNSSDKTKQIAKKYTNKVYNFGPERSAQRNYGVKKSRGKYLMILDADMKLSKNVIKECIDLMEANKNIGGVVIPEHSVAKSFWEKVKAYERTFYFDKGDTNIEAARFFSNKVFIEAGGYDNTITGPEDWDLPERILKLGYKQSRTTSVIYHYERVPNPLNLAVKKYYYALTTYRYLRKHKIPLVGPKTVYFLRPVFYKNWKKLLLHPILSISMVVMLTCEQMGGLLGFISGRIKKI